MLRAAKSVIWICLFKTFFHQSPFFTQLSREEELAVSENDHQMHGTGRKIAAAKLAHKEPGLGYVLESAYVFKCI